jgi:hypothetical protein
MRRLHFALLSLVLVLAAQPLLATTYYVTPPLGYPCTSEKGGFVVFPSIQYAVTHVPKDSTINICSGTYYEQVTISQPLTLRGVSYNNSSQVIIAMPPGALTTTPSLLFGTVAAQVEVTAEAVNITGITLDGTASSSNCPSVDTVGIFYSSGSSGTVNGVQARYQNCGFAISTFRGVGILAEGQGSSHSITIKNSYIHDNGECGIAAYGASLTASMEDNDVEDDTEAIVQQAADGSVSGNTVIASSAGILVYAGVVSDNTVGGVNAVTPGGGTITYTEDDGIDVYAAATVMSNHISNSSCRGIRLLTGGATVTSNIITSNNLINTCYGVPEAPVGIDFGCYTNTVSGNTINGTATGIELVPTTFKGVNAFYSVPTINYEGGGGC